MKTRELPGDDLQHDFGMEAVQSVERTTQHGQFSALHIDLDSVDSSQTQLAHDIIDGTAAHLEGPGRFLRRNIRILAGQRRSACIDGGRSVQREHLLAVRASDRLDGDVFRVIGRDIIAQQL